MQPVPVAATTRGGPAIKGSPALTTETSVIHPILACLDKAEEELGAGRVWTPTNELQTRFLREFFPRMGDITKFSAAELKSILSKNADAINAFLAENGFQIKLEQFGELEFGVASVLNVLVEWLSLGKVTQLDLHGRGVFPAVHLKGDQGVDVLDAGSLSPHPIVSIATKTGDRLCMTIASEQHQGFDLTERVQALRKGVSGLGRARGQFDGAVFPMVHFDREVDIEWILAMSTADANGIPAVITQAKQQTRFRMNERGARAESAVAIGISRTCIEVRRPYIVDRPFILWIERPGVELPIFSGLFAEDVWKNPGSLD